MVPTGPTWATQSSRSGWRWLRRVLIGGWVIVAASGLFFGERPSSLPVLSGDVAAGRVHVVDIAGGLRPGVRGASLVELHWRRGLFRYQTTVIEARPRRQANDVQLSGPGTTPVVTGGVEARLGAAQPGLRIVHVPRTGSSFSVSDWQLPGWYGWAFLLLLLGTLVLLSGPRPWRGTRWAWSWLVLLAGPVGIPAVLFLAGPTPPLPAPRPGARRLTGGWAFLLALVIGSRLHGSP